MFVVVTNMIVAIAVEKNADVATVGHVMLAIFVWGLHNGLLSDIPLDSNPIDGSRI